MSPLALGLEGCEEVKTAGRDRVLPTGLVVQGAMMLGGYKCEKAAQAFSIGYVRCPASCRWTNGNGMTCDAIPIEQQLNAECTWLLHGDADDLLKKPLPKTCEREVHWNVLVWRIGKMHSQGQLEVLALIAVFSIQGAYRNHHGNDASLDFVKDVKGAQSIGLLINRATFGN